MATRNINDFRTLVLGPRPRRQVELRIRELEARPNPSIFDLAEIARLKEMLASAGGGHAA